MPEASSPAPGTPQTATKAYVAAGLAALVTFVGIWVADADPFTLKEIAAGLVSAVVASGVIGVGAYYAPNQAK